jgi:Spy/CpxP family protein refolding chaperone
MLAIAVVAATALAQRVRMSPEERTEHLTKQLSLTEEQKAKVLEIFNKSDKEMRAAFSENAGDRDKMRDIMQRNRKETEVQMKKVLTEEQFAKWEKLRSEAPGRGRPEGKPAMPDSK